jgi:predicted transcriptional regulator
MPAENTPTLPEWSHDSTQVLVAIDAGWQDCESGLVSPMAEVEAMVSLWISKYSSRTKPSGT